MFIEPIKRTPLSTMEDLIEFSYRTSEKADKCLTYWSNNGEYAFTDEDGFVYVTPYRPEVYSILEHCGFSSDFLYVPFSNGIDKIPIEYHWLQQMANRQCRAFTGEKAFQVALQKQLQEVKPNLKGLHITEITSWTEDAEAGFSYSPMASNWSDWKFYSNIGTYIIVNEKTLIICDEYGRTFLVKVSKVINELVNSLIDAGYTECSNPAFYVYTHPAKEEEKTN